ncbi:MAG: SDR family NAD(P)-dependent oxidoreductase [Gammaproteobacteria bacterium]
MSDKTNLLDLTGRVALVSGAGQGVGAKTAEYLAAQGASVIVNDYVLDRAEAVAQGIRQENGRALALQADVTDFEAVAGMVEKGAVEFGAIDVLVNNAGNAGANPSGITGKPFWDKDPSEWEPFIQVNLYGVLNCCRAVIPVMIEAGNGGRLITIISDAGRVGESGLEAYSAAKAGAAGLMRALARSLGRYEITANSIAIGATNTPAIQNVTRNEELLKRVLKNYIIRRVGEPSDVAAMVTFLASSAASWTTGQTYPVNGGFSVNQ